MTLRSSIASAVAWASAVAPIRPLAWERPYAATTGRRRGGGGGGRRRKEGRGGEGGGGGGRGRRRRRSRRKQFLQSIASEIDLILEQS